MKTTHELKKKEVENLYAKIKDSKTLLIASIKGLPSKQFQEIKKSIRDEALVKMSKKNILVRVIKKLEDKNQNDLENYVKEDCVFVISELEGYELARILNKKKTPAFAKAGQIAISDIEIKEGPTDLVPGPAISELSSVGLQVAVEDGKLAIKKGKVIAKEGDEITGNLASVLQKLKIQPFNIGLEPVVVYDIQEHKLYKDIKIDSEAVAKEISSAVAKALGFAQKISYYCKETVGYLLGKAKIQSEHLEKLQPKEEKEKNEEVEGLGNSEEKNSENKEENQEEKETKNESSEEKDNETQLNKPEEKA